MTNILIDFRKSKNKNKKYEITLLIDGKKKTFNFGSNVSKSFVEGATLEKRNNYLKRHSVNEDWNYINKGEPVCFSPAAPAAPVRPAAPARPAGFAGPVLL